MEMTSWPGEERQKAYARQQATVADLGQRALMGTSLSTLLDNAVALVAHTLDVEFCRVMELLPGGKTMLLRAGVGWREGLVGHVTVGAEAAGCQSYYTLACIEPVIVHDYNTETRFSIPPLLQEHGAVSGLSVVIGGQGRRQPFGVLGVHTRQRRDFTEDDIHFLQAIANVLAAAIERQQAETQLRESERRFQRMVANAPGMVYQFVLHPDGSVAFPYVSEGCREVCGLEPEEVQADAARALDMIHPQDRPLFDRAVAESAASLQPKKWEGRILLPTGEQKWLQLASRPERQANGDVLWDGLLIDITERKRAEHVSHGLTTALTRQLSALTARPELDTFLGQVLAAIAEVLESRHGSLWFLDAEQEALILHMTYESGQIIVGEQMRHPYASTPLFIKDVPYWPELVSTRQPIVIADIAHDSPPNRRDWLTSQGFRSLLKLPLLDHDVLGWISVSSTEYGRYRPEEVELAHALAQQASLAVQLARLAKQEQQAAVLHERNRLAREIHDTLAQGFTGILLQLEAAEEAIPDGAGQAHIARARDLARQCLAEARRSVWALRPQALEQDGLPIALASLARQMTAGTAVRSELHVHGTPRSLPSEIESDLLRIGLEALTNALRHAQASVIRIELTFDPDRVRLSVQDNGQGFHPSLEAAGLGVIGIRERAKRMGGRFQVTSQPGQGTEIAVLVPASASNNTGVRHETRRSHPHSDR